MAESILKVEQVSLAFGGVKALSDISFEVKKVRSFPSSDQTEPVRHRCLTASQDATNPTAEKSASNSRTSPHYSPMIEPAWAWVAPSKI